MENKEPVISIIMPLYNAEKYVDNAICSVINQTYNKWELIIVNDKSKDSSGKICDEWAEKDKRIQVIHLTENKGAGNARNVGIDRARGEYITFLDSDDCIEKELYEKVVDSLQKTKTDVCVWGVKEQYFDIYDNMFLENTIISSKKVCKNQEETRRIVIELESKSLFGYQWNKLYRKKIIEENSIYFDSVHLYEDYFFNLNFIKKAQTLNIIDFAGYIYKKRENQSLTKQYVKEYFELSHKRIKTMFDVYEEWGMLNDKVETFLGKTYLRYILSALERNCTKNSNMSLKKQTKWIKIVGENELYIKISKNCKVNNCVLRLLQILINKKIYFLCVVMGQGVHLIKVKFPKRFSEKVKYK